MLTKYIDRINILGATRIARVGAESHGLGLVGQPLLPYLGARSAYEIALPDRPVEVWAILVDLPRYASGHYRRARVDFDALGAPDVTAAHWDGDPR